MLLQHRNYVFRFYTVKVILHLSDNKHNQFTVPYIIYFQAVKIGDELTDVYNVDMFNFKEGYDYLELVTVCQFGNSLFRDLGSIELGFVSEEDLEKDKEMPI